jgi:deoxyhypusine synthase
MTRQSISGYIPDNTTNLDYLPHIKGYDFNEKFNFEKFLKSYSSSGFQASNLGKSIEIIKAMVREKATIFLAYTSNMVSSGNREVIRYLVGHKLVHALITTAGGIEEDIIKTLRPFVLGSFTADGKYLSDKGVNRIGNILVTNDRYVYFEKFMTPFLEKIYNEQKKTGKIFASSEIIEKVGYEVNDRSSILYWASKNKIPVFCPALTDGSFGDMLFWRKQAHKDFKVDVLEDMQKIVNLSLNAEKTGVIILGGGTAKHYTLNSQIFREGAEYAVFINTGSDFDGSDSGASIDEAISWNKIKANAMQAKVTADATIVFPLVIAGVLQGKRNLSRALNK